MHNLAVVVVHSHILTLVDQHRATTNRLLCLPKRSTRGRSGRRIRHIGLGQLVVLERRGERVGLLVDAVNPGSLERAVSHLTQRSTHRIGRNLRAVHRRIRKTGFRLELTIHDAEAERSTIPEVTTVREGIGNTLTEGLEAREGRSRRLGGLEVRRHKAEVGVGLQVGNGDVTLRYATIREGALERLKRHALGIVRLGSIAGRDNRHGHTNRTVQLILGSGDEGVSRGGRQILDLHIHLLTLDNRTLGEYLIDTLRQALTFGVEVGTLVGIVDRKADRDVVRTLLNRRDRHGRRGLGRREDVGGVHLLFAADKEADTGQKHHQSRKFFHFIGLL